MSEADNSAADTSVLFNRSDYEQLPEGFPAQLIEGELIRDPAPDYGHQRIAARIHLRLAALVEPDRVIESPIDVVIDNHNVFQPDVLVLEHTPDPDARYAGLPMLVVEVLSPSTARLDREKKRLRFLAAGVREVWLIDRVSETIELYAGDSVRIFDRGETAGSEALPGFRLAYADLFPA